MPILLIRHGVLVRHLIEDSASLRTKRSNGYDKEGFLSYPLKRRYFRVFGVRVLYRDERRAVFEHNGNLFTFLTFKTTNSSKIEYILEQSTRQLLPWWGQRPAVSSVSRREAS